MDWQTMETAPHDGAPVLLWGTPNGWTSPWYVIATWGPDQQWLSDERGEPVLNPTRWCPIPAHRSYEEGN